MSFEENILAFQKKNNLGDEDIADLMHIWNKSLVDLAHELLKKETVERIIKITDKKWATKITQGYAEENGLTLDDFNKEKITKQDVNEYLKNKKSIVSSSSACTSTITKTKKNTICCSGMTKKGEKCSKSGTHKPDGAKYMYCFSHAETWKDYELSSDSSDLSEDETETETKIVT